jgi:hypothetical protein
MVTALSPKPKILEPPKVHKGRIMSTAKPYCVDGVHGSMLKDPRNRTIAAFASA